MTDNPSASKRGNFSVDLRGRTAVVTGASTGIGEAIAQGLLDSNARVIALQRRGTCSLVGDFEVVQVDLSNPEEIFAAAKSIVEEHRVDILVNNAGITARHAFVDYPLADWQRVLQVDLTAVMQLCQVFGTDMVKRESGRIVNIASMQAFAGGHSAAAYSAAKGGVVQLTESLCTEWAGSGVKVNAIAPGFFYTDMNAEALTDHEKVRQVTTRIPAGRWETKDIANAALFLVLDAANYIHGVTVPVDGGFLRADQQRELQQQLALGRSAGLPQVGMEMVVTSSVTVTTRV